MAVPSSNEAIVVGTPSQVTIIGIDSAVDPKNVGLARGVLANGQLRLIEVASVQRRPDELVERVASWVTLPTLLAIDAPLGWPRALGLQLSEHRAGQQVSTTANALFRRFTDGEIYRRYRVTPLDVGADRIARTAFAALELLAAVRGRIASDVPLLWAPGFAGVGAIEVYPAATLVARGLSRFGYKKDPMLRRTLLAALVSELGVDPDGPTAAAMLDREHSLDAALCVLGGADFVAGRAQAPAAEHRAVAEGEGWIWVRGT